MVCWEEPDNALLDAESPQELGKYLRPCDGGGNGDNGHTDQSSAKNRISRICLSVCMCTCTHTHACMHACANVFKCNL